MSEKVIQIRVQERKALIDLMRNCTEEAVKALSEMINRKVEITSTSAEIMRINNISNLMNPNDVTTTVLFTKLADGIPGVVFLSSPLKDILRMADIFLHKEPGHFNGLSDENTSVIKEFAFIIMGYYVSTLNKILCTKYAMSAAELSVNPYRVIEDFGMGAIYTEEVLVLALGTRFEISAGGSHEKENIKEDIFVLFKNDDARLIIKKFLTSNSHKKSSAF